MSAFFVQPGTVDAAAKVIIGHERQPTDVTGLGRALYRMNVAALSQRYNLPADELADYEEQAASYSYVDGYLDALAAYKGGECLLYQCCEGDVPSWDLYGRLERALAGLKDALNRGRPLGLCVTRTSEYEAAAWDVVRPAMPLHNLDTRETSPEPQPGPEPEPQPGPEPEPEPEPRPVMPQPVRHAVPAPARPAVIRDAVIDF